MSGLQQGISISGGGISEFPYGVSGVGGLSSSDEYTFRNDLLNTIVPQFAAGSATPTFVRTSTAFVQDWENLFKPCLSGEVRFTGARRVQNTIRNTAMNGAAVGTPGTDPTNWGDQFLTTTGVTKSVVGTGVENNLPYIDIRLNGTAGGGAGAWQIWFENTVAIAALTGQQWVLSCYLKLIGGTLNGITTTLLGISEYTSAPAFIKSNNTTIPNATAAGARNSQITTLSGGATTAAVQPLFQMGIQNGAAIDITVRIYAPQLEQVTGQSNQNPSEYVSTGLLSAPYHGANVDGVKYFLTLNGNTVASNVVTEAPGPTINPANGGSSATVKADGPFGYNVERPSTNLVLRSDDFTLAWTAVGAPTNTAGGGIPYIGTQTIGDDSAAVLKGYTQNITFTGDEAKSVSVFVKKGTSTSTIIRLQDVTAGITRLRVTITWSGNVPVVTMTAGIDLTGTPVQIGNSGGYRLMFRTGGVTAANVNSLEIYPATDTGLSVAGTGTIEIGGIQVEEGSEFISSYIPTGAATVQRNADTLTYPAAGNVNQVNGTLYAEFMIPNDAAGSIFPGILSLDDGTVNERYSLYSRTTDDTVRFNVTDGAVTQADFSLGSTSYGSFNKVAATYALNNFVGVLAGGAPQSDLTGTTPAVTTISVGMLSTNNNSLGGFLRNVRVYPSILPSGVLQSMTQ